MSHTPELQNQPLSMLIIEVLVSLLKMELARAECSCYINRPGTHSGFPEVQFKLRVSQLPIQIGLWPTLVFFYPFYLILYYLLSKNSFWVWVEERNGHWAGRMMSKGLRWDRTSPIRPSRIFFSIDLSLLWSRSCINGLPCLIFASKDVPCWISLSLTVGRQALSCNNLTLM